jgi:hypothetical protein
MRIVYFFLILRHHYRILEGNGRGLTILEFGGRSEESHETVRKASAPAEIRIEHLSNIQVCNELLQ